MKNTVSTFAKIVAILFAVIHTTFAADKYSIANGNWTTGTTWSNTLGGASCNCTPAKSDNIYIYNNVTLDKDLTGGAQGLTGIVTIYANASLNGANTYSLELRSSATFTVHGSLTVKDLTLNSGSNILFQTGSSVTVNGTFFNKTGSNNVTINGVMTVNGTFTNNSSAIITGTGNIVINTGPATNGVSGSIFGSSTASPCSTFPCILGPGPLPVELIAFTASRTIYGVDINWATASEINNDYFTVERTTDPTVWEEVTTVRGAGNSNHELHYKYTDNHPVMADCYYRLRQTDYDGNSQTFNSVFVEATAAFYLRLYPNPASGNKITINFNDNDINGAIVKVYDMTGSEVKTKLFADRGNSAMNIEIDAEALKSARMFFVTVIIGDKVLREKLVINQSFAN